ncbi:MAG: peptide chain release factor N(5)-glutamine methyltransferase [Chloroflexi bacterium]|nr:peptide chain release factor N(5)-glutamine methyltransferase [Chloroflexota bacterium]MBT7081762.1 peptide chain release factor N(5)-glutamine methyltransferase [Chloroflexota bacterium]MBT7289402.1 peptide chain release factor N(5)-glutamine methyltransferase [Chloroflexota bacterium]
MTIKEALSATRKTLASHHVAESDLEAQLLLRHATGLSKEQLFIDINRELTDEQCSDIELLTQRRIAGTPIAYITGHKEFFGLDFTVNPSVLIPRPETELLVELAIDIAHQHKSRLIVDIGTGSGAIAVSLATHLPDAKMYAVDISSDALKTTATNCQKHAVTNRVQLLHGNLLDPLPERVDIIVANLPYVTTGQWEQLPGEIKANEPKSALDGGADGLDVITELLATAKDKLRPNGSVLLEIGYDQGKAILKLAKKYFPDAQIEIADDLAGLNRVVSIVTYKESNV